MIIVSNRLIIFFSFILGMKKHGGIRALAFFPFIIISKETILDDELINHERIHLRQQLELLIIPFYIWYLIAIWRRGYYGISFEREAHLNDSNLEYLKKRRPYSFIKYILKKW